MKRSYLFSLAGGFGYRKPSPALPAGRHGLLAGLLLSGLIFLPPAFSQTNETLTISTYYPSPYGVYSEMRLYPKTPEPTCDSTEKEGLMYYNSAEHALKVCRCIKPTCFIASDYGWQSASSLWTLNGTNLYPNNTTAWNVGIGTTAPGDTLHVYEAGGQQVATFESGTTGAALGTFIGFNDHTGGVSHTNVVVGSVNGNLVLQTVSGNVGIGTTGPVASLDVFRTNDGGNSLSLTYPGAIRYDFVRSATTGFLSIQGTQISANSILLAPTSGNVGIGTTVPDTKLQVRDGNDRLAFYQPADNRMAIQTLLDDRAFSTYGTYGGDTENRLILQPLVGNVGIGMTAPAVKLDVAGSGVVGLRYLKSGSKDSRIQVGDPTKVWALAVGWATAGDFSIIEEGAAGDRLYIQQGGNVGIGTTGPDSKLVVMSNNVGGTDRANQLVIKGLSNQNLKLNLGIHTEAIPPYADIGFVEEMVAWRNLVLVKNGGNVGIGTANPGAYRLYVEGAAYATGGWIASDIRFKEDIAPISDALGTIAKLKGVSFRWKVKEYKEKGFVEGKHFGVIAQEVEAVLPEVVREGPDGEKNVSYTEFVPILINAVKELKQANDELKFRIKALEMTLEKS